MPFDRSRYPSDWEQIRARLLERAGHRCEGSPAYPDCRAANYQPHPVTGSKVVLTIGHFNHDVSDNTDGNLFAWCNRCHLTHDAALHATNARRTREARSGQTRMEIDD